MKKKIIILTIAILAVGAAGLGAFGIAGAAGLELPALQAGGTDPVFGRMVYHNGDGPLRPYVEEATAEILGITVEDLQAALDDGQSMVDLIEAAGLTVAEFYEALEAALPEIVEQALADGAITEELAEAILENGIPMRPWQNAALEPYVLAATADILGMDVDELEAALEAGTTMGELLDEAGLTHLAFRQAMDDATPGIVRTALADEAITEELADRILEYGLPLGPCGPAHHRRGEPGGFGPGGFGPGGFGPGSFGPGGFGPGSFGPGEPNGPQGFGPGSDGAPFLGGNG